MEIGRRNVDRLGGDSFVSLAFSIGDHSYFDDSDQRASIVYSHVSFGYQREPDVSFGDGDLHRSSRRRCDCGSRNAYKKLEEWETSGRKGDYHQVRFEALLEVGPSVFFSLLIIAVAFIPVFALVDQEGRLFKPLAYSKNIAMAVAAVLAITLDPAFRMLFTRVDPLNSKVRFFPRSQPLFLWGNTLGSSQSETNDLFRVTPRNSYDTDVFQFGIGVNASFGRGNDSLHADNVTRNWSNRSRRTHDRDGSKTQIDSRGQKDFRKIGKIRNSDRLGSVLHDGNGFTFTS